MRLELAKGLSCGAALTVLALLSTSGPLSAQYEGFEPGEVRTLDLKTGTVEDDAKKEKLPFDVHFYLRGDLEPGFEEVTARYRGFRIAQNCQEAFNGTQIVVEYGPRRRRPVRRLAKAVAGDDLGKAAIIKVETTEDSKKVEKDQFEVLVPALQPNRHYCFQLVFKRQIDKKRLEEKLRPAMAKAIELRLREVRIRDVGKRAKYEELRGALIREVKAELAENEQLVAPAGSYFDSGTDYDLMRQEFRLQFDDVLRTQLQMQSAIEGSVIPSIEEAADALGTLARATFGPGGKTLAELLTQAKKNSSIVSGRLESIKKGSADGEGVPGIDLVALLELGEADDRIQREELAEGLPPGEEVTPLADVWTTTGLETRIARVKALSNALSQLEDLLPEVKKQTGIDDAAIAGIEALIAAATKGKTGADEAAGLGVLEFGEWTGVVGRLKELQDVIAQREERITAVVDTLTGEIEKEVRVRGTTVASYETRSVWYVSADLGGGWAPDTDDLFTYVGANVYLRPVNKKAHLSWADFRGGDRWNEFLKRFALLLGLTYGDFGDKADPGQFQPAVRGRALVAGAGVRLNDSLRFTAGAVVFEDTDPNPLIEDTKLAWTPFVAVSIDWNAQQTFARIFGAVVPGGAEEGKKP